MIPNNYRERISEEAEELLKELRRGLYETHHDEDQFVITIERSYIDIETNSGLITIAEKME